MVGVSTDYSAGRQAPGCYHVEDNYSGEESGFILNYVVAELVSIEDNLIDLGQIVYRYEFRE